MKLSEKYALRAAAVPDPKTKGAFTMHTEAALVRGVQMTGELIRIMHLPRRDLGVELGGLGYYYEGSDRDVNDLYSKFVDKCGYPNCLVCLCGPPRMRSIQNALLWEAYEQNGAVGSMKVGSGKTLCTLLLMDALNSKRAVLFIPPALKKTFIKIDVPAYRRHFHIPPVYTTEDLLRDIAPREVKPGLYVITYQEISSIKFDDVLERIHPDLVMADEAHRLRNKSASRTKRFHRFMEKYAVRFVPLSGTFSRRSVRDGAPLSELALKKGSPYPRNPGDIRDWAAALDPDNPKPMTPGALMYLCEPGEQAIDGFRRRRIETPGLISTGDLEDDVGVPLILRARKPAIPLVIEKALDFLRSTWCWDGEEIAEAMIHARVARQLAAGFYYRWVWPSGQKDVEWLEARAAWHREVRETLKYASRARFDSPLLLWNAAERGEWRAEHWKAWAAVHKRYVPHPPVEAVWLSDFLVQDVAKWAKERTAKPGGGIVWTMHRALGLRLASDLKLPNFGAGTGEALAKARPETHPVIICSQRAHGTGQNLQRYSSAYITTPAANAVDTEQVLGRLHRPGQLAEEVLVDICAYTDELRSAYYQAQRDAVFLERADNERQKILYANKIDL